MSTNALSSKKIIRNYHLVDANQKVLGRLATEIATKLMGKQKAEFVPFLDTGDFVVVTNATLVLVTGKKEEQKKYARHSGYPGGFRVETLADLRKRKPEEIIKHAVAGMLPKTKLGKKMIKKLYIFPGEKHTFEKQLGAKS
ncbi:50S ribosomal protein L13 [Candidatus Daviesbacteria bacterium]|nr:50S ribosomal protein L13 [Candidatus Daviesbacteria bacterium]